QRQARGDSADRHARAARSRAGQVRDHAVESRVPGADHASGRRPRRRRAAAQRAIQRSGVGETSGLPMKRALVLLCLAALPALAAEQWYQAYTLGVNAVRSKNYDAAAEALERAVAEMPTENGTARAGNL